MNLYEIRSTHYAPKDRHEASMGFLLARDQGAAVRAIFEQGFCYEDISEIEADVGPYFISADRINHDLANALGLTPDEDGDYTDLTLLQAFIVTGSDPRDVTDLYYGATQYRVRLALEDPPAEVIGALRRIGMLLEGEVR